MSTIFELSQLNNQEGGNQLSWMQNPQPQSEEGGMGALAAQQAAKRQADEQAARLAAQQASAARMSSAPATGGYDFSNWAGQNINNYETRPTVLPSDTSNMGLGDFLAADKYRTQQYGAAPDTYRGSDYILHAGLNDPRYQALASTYANTPDKFDDFVYAHPEVLGQLNTRAQANSADNLGPGETQLYRDHPDAYWANMLGDYGYDTNMLSASQLANGDKLRQFQSPGAQGARGDARHKQGFKDALGNLVAIATIFAPVVGGALMGGGAAAAGGMGEAAGATGLASLGDSVLSAADAFGVGGGSIASDAAMAAGAGSSMGGLGQYATGLSSFDPAYINSAADAFGQGGGTIAQDAANAAGALSSNTPILEYGGTNVVPSAASGGNGVGGYDPMSGGSSSLMDNLKTAKNIYDMGKKIKGIYDLVNPKAPGQMNQQSVQDQLQQLSGGLGMNTNRVFGLGGTQSRGVGQLARFRNGGLARVCDCK